MAAPLPQAVKLMLASQDHRLKHYIWHGVRNSWLQMGTTAAGPRRQRRLPPRQHFRPIV